jgi:hypothetical protein
MWLNDEKLSDTKYAEKSEKEEIKDKCFPPLTFDVFLVDRPTNQIKSE